VDRRAQLVDEHEIGGRVVRGSGCESFARLSGAMFAKRRNSGRVDRELGRRRIRLRLCDRTLPDPGTMSTIGPRLDCGWRAHARLALLPQGAHP
jgi:hypothetical protein